MMIQIENVAPGQTFRTSWGGEAKMLRHIGDVQQPNRNQWGRAEGGSHTEHSCAVKWNEGRRGWRFRYASFYPGSMVVVED